MGVEQSTLVEQGISERVLQSYEQKDTQSIEDRLSREKLPEPDDVHVNVDKIHSIISELNLPLSVFLRDKELSYSMRKFLEMVAFKKSGKNKFLENAIDFTVSVNCPDDKASTIREALGFSFSRLPTVTAALTSSWIQGFFYLDDASFQNMTGRTSYAYYDPNNHYVAIRNPILKPKPDKVRQLFSENETKFVRSHTVHELGHALHYMIGIQIVNSDSHDNREQEDWQTTFREKNLSDWQKELKKKATAGYQKLENGEYETLKFSNYQEKSIEEFIAVGFEAWVSNPKFLKNKQPLLWEFFESLP